MNTELRLDILFQVLIWLIHLILCGLSIFYSNEVWEKYATQETSYKRSIAETSKLESLAVVIGFWPLKKMENTTLSVQFQTFEQLRLGEDFSLTFGVTQYKKIAESIILENYGTNYSVAHSSIGSVTFQQCISKWGNYYRISANIFGVRLPFEPFVRVNFSQEIPLAHLPNTDVYLSSEANSYGVTMYDWKDGDRVQSNKIKGSQIFTLQPLTINSMKSPFKCQDEAYYECFEAKMSKENFSECPTKCSAISTYSDLMPICQTKEEFECANEIALKIQNDNSSQRCLPSCRIVNYSVKHTYSEDTESDQAKRDIFIRYHVEGPKMLELNEYVIYDFGAMLGSIGGTLGMFVGFSFAGCFSFLLTRIRLIIEYILKKKANKVEDEKVIIVQEMPEENNGKDEIINQCCSLIQNKVVNTESRLEDIMRNQCDRKIKEVERDISKLSKILGIRKLNKNKKV